MLIRDHFWMIKVPANVTKVETAAHFLSFVPNHTAPESRAAAVTESPNFFQMEFS